MLLNATPHFKRLFRLRSILLLVMLSVLLLPLSSLYFFRFYENELVRKTELELITQSAAFSAVYRELIHKNHYNESEQYTPITPQLDLSKQSILARRPHGQTSTLLIDPIAQHAGEQMQTILRNTQQFTLAGMRILDKNGVVIAGGNELGLSFAHVEEVHTALSGHYHAVLRDRVSDSPQPSLASLSRGSGIRVFTAFPIMDQGQLYGVVYLSRTPQNILKHLDGIKGRVLLIACLLLGVTSLIVLFISARLSRPIRELIEQTKKVTQGEIKTISVIKQPGTYELAELSTSFAEMSHILNERSHYLAQFAGHVSHEFKTPLTSMQGSLELLQDHFDDMPKAQRQRFLTNLQEDTKRLENLVTRLLEQARADTSQSSTETTELVDVIRALQSVYKDKQLSILFENKITPRLAISSDALTRILTNLFENSLQHGASEVIVEASQIAGKLSLTLHDNGSGISSSNQKRIFTPFFTTRRETGGTGLGLGIIESTLKAWGGSIKLKDVSQGACFIITLNKS